MKDRSFWRLLFCLPRRSKTHHTRLKGQKSGYRVHRSDNYYSKPPTHQGRRPKAPPIRPIVDSAGPDHFINKPLPPLPPPTSQFDQTEAVTLSTSNTMHSAGASNVGMSPPILAEVIDTIGRCLYHVPYAVCGLAAMACYGFDEISPRQVTIACPSDSKDVLVRWAAVNRLHTYPSKPDVFGIKTLDGKIRHVRVKALEEEEAFDNLETIEVGDSRTRVLTLPSLADQTAQEYTKALEWASGQRKDLFANRLLWILQRSAKSSSYEQKLTPERAPHIVQDLFWVPFTLSCPESVSLLRGVREPESNKMVDGSLCWCSSDHECWAEAQERNHTRQSRDGKSDCFRRFPLEHPNGTEYARERYARRRLRRNRTLMIDTGELALLVR